LLVVAVDDGGAVTGEEGIGAAAWSDLDFLRIFIDRINSVGMVPVGRLNADASPLTTGEAWVSFFGFYGNRERRVNYAFHAPSCFFTIVTSLDRVSFLAFGSLILICKRKMGRFGITFRLHIREKIKSLSVPITLCRSRKMAG
jgi:hypothetical protein